MPTINSFIRFLHASPGAPDVDIYVDGNMVVKDLDYTEVSKYLPVGPEDMHIQVFPAGDTTSPVIDTEVNIPPSERITISIIGTLPNINLLPILLSVEPVDTPTVLLRVVHLSPNTPQVDVTVTDGVMFNNLEYKQVSEFVTIPPGSYNIQVRLSGEDEIVLTSEIELLEGKAYTVNILGLLEENPPLEIIYYKDQIPFIGSNTVDNRILNEKIPSIQINKKIIFTYE